MINLSFLEMIQVLILNFFPFKYVRPGSQDKVFNDIYFCRLKFHTHFYHCKMNFWIWILFRRWPASTRVFLSGSCTEDRKICTEAAEIWKLGWNIKLKNKLKWKYLTSFSTTAAQSTGLCWFCISEFGFISIKLDSWREIFDINFKYWWFDFSCIKAIEHYYLQLKENLLDHWSGRSSVSEERCWEMASLALKVDRECDCSG